MKKNFGEELKTVEFIKEPKKFPISLTDASYFIPNSEAVKSIDKTATMSHDPALYDYPNGETGTDTTRIAEIRKPGQDIVEVSAGVKEITAEAQKALTNDANDKINKEVAKKTDTRGMIADIASRTAKVETTTQK